MELGIQWFVKQEKSRKKDRKTISWFLFTNEMDLAREGLVISISFHLKKVLSYRLQTREV